MQHLERVGYLANKEAKEQFIAKGPRIGPRMTPISVGILMNPPALLPKRTPALETLIVTYKSNQFSGEFQSYSIQSKTHGAKETQETQDIHKGKSSSINVMSRLYGFAQRTFSDPDRPPTEAGKEESKTEASQSDISSQENHDMGQQLSTAVEKNSSPE
jgi:hypothetical protein